MLTLIFRSTLQCAGFPQRLENLEILEIKNGHGKVMEHEKLTHSHGLFCDQSWNFSCFAPEFDQIRTLFADLKKVIISLESKEFSTFSNTKFGQRYDHGKSGNGHEKVMEKLVAKSVGTLECETFNGNSKILALIISKNNLIEVGKPDGEFILHIQGGGGGRVMITLKGTTRATNLSLYWADAKYVVPFVSSVGCCSVALPFA